MSADAAVNSKVYSRPLKGSEKVAILLLALDRSLASQLLHHFEPDEISTIRSAADSLEPITASDLESIVEEFARQFSTGLGFVGKPGELHSLLETALGSPEETEIPEGDDLEQLVVAPAVWAQLAKISIEEVLLPFLLKEHPQTVTVILSNMTSEVSAKIVAQLPDNLSAEIMRRMLSLKQVHEDVLSLIEDTLREELLAEEEEGAANAGHSRIANMINRMDGDQRQQIIDNITAAAPEEAEAIKKLLFSFEDIEELSEEACQILFGTVATEVTVMALHETEGGLREKILSSLSARSRRMVEAELNGASDVAMEDIKEARFKVSGTALSLIESEQIQIEEEGD